MRIRIAFSAAMASAFLALFASRGRAEMTVQGITVGVDPGRWDRFAGGPSFIGDGIDWSGTGRRITNTNGKGPEWTTLISPSFIVSASHTVADVSHPDGPFDPDPNSLDRDVTAIRFFPDNSGANSVDREIVGSWHLGADLWLGQLASPVPKSISPVPLLNLQDPEDLAGQEIYLYGNAGSSYDLPQRQRIGRNVVDGFVSPSDPAFGFTYEGSIADIAGPQPSGISDGTVDSHDWDVFESNYGMVGPTHLDGDLNRDGQVDLDDGQILFEEGIRLSGVTSGLGWDEATTVGGDSGGPSFRIIDGKPALMGLHSSYGIDRYVGISFDDIVDKIILESGGSERAISMTGKRSNFFASKDGLALPSGLQKLNLFPGDLDGDFIEDAVDINLLNREISAASADPLRSVNLGMDFNNDGNLDASDRTAFLEDVLGTFFGDANLDGVVTQAGDIDPSLANIGKSPAQWTFPNDGWRSGDFNGDGVVNLTLDILPALTFASSAYKGLRRIDPDFVDDGVLDQLDIESIAAAARAGIDPDSYDFTGDGVVDEDDRIYFIEKVLGTLVGDRDLSGGIHLADALFPQSGSATWANGDMDGDGDADQADYDIILNAISSGNNIAPPGDLPTLPIPEPTGVPLLAMAIIGFLSQHRRPVS